MTRGPHPDDVRDELRAWAQRRRALQHERDMLTAELGDIASRCAAAGVSLAETARLAGVSRTTVYTARDRARPFLSIIVPRGE